MDQAALLDAYLGGPDRLRSAVAGLSREQLVSRPVAGRWSVLEVRANAKRGVLAAVLAFRCLVLLGCGDVTGAKMTRANSKAGRGADSD
jgi:hypothetical protein